MVSYWHQVTNLLSHSLVLILVVVEDGLVLGRVEQNPQRCRCLNPCCSGRWSRTFNDHVKDYKFTKVLILVVVEDGLVLFGTQVQLNAQDVLILVVVEDGLVRVLSTGSQQLSRSLNPCCSGRWSRTTLTNYGNAKRFSVLILVVVEDGLVPLLKTLLILVSTSLNPCCSGRWSRTC